MGKKSKNKRIISIIASLCMLLSLLLNPAIVKADELGEVIYDESTKTLTISGKLTDENLNEIKRYYATEKVVLNNAECVDASKMFANLTFLKKVEIDGFETKKTSQMFSNCIQLEELSVKNWDISKVEYMNGMFETCMNLKEVPVKDWDVSNVTDMSKMFYNCQALENVPVEDWNVSNVENMSGMFLNCKSLKRLTADNWDVSNVTDMSAMFNQCTSLEYMPIEKWNTCKVGVKIDNMFTSCEKLANLDSKARYASFLFKDIFENRTLNAWGGIRNVGTSVSRYTKDLPERRLVLASDDENDRRKTLTVSEDINNNTIENQFVRLFKVKFNDANGITRQEKDVKDGKSVSADIRPTKPADAQYTYTFAGWDKELDCVREDMVVNPKFDSTVNKYNYSIIYKCGDNVISRIDDEAEYGTEITVESKEITGYKLKSKPVETIKITENEGNNVAYVDYNKIHTVKFFDDENNLLDTKYVEDGQAADKPADPAKKSTESTSYTFVKWDKSFDNVTGDMDIKAIFKDESIKYNYSIVYKCGDNKLDSEEGNLDYGSTINAADKIKPFDGYVLKPGYKEQLTIGNDAGENVLTFEYDKLTTVIVRDALGKEISRKQIAPGEKPEVPGDIQAPTKAATAQYTYTFNEWKTVTANNGDVEIIPDFKEELNKYDYSIIYRCGDEVLDTVKGNAEYNTEITAEAKEFDGYNLKSNAGDKLVVTENDNVLYVDYAKVEDEAEGLDESNGAKNAPNRVDGPNADENAGTEGGSVILNVIKTGDSTIVIFAMLMAAAGLTAIVSVVNRRKAYRN